MENQIDVINADGTEIGYTFRLEEAGDVVKMLIKAAGAGAGLRIKDHDHYVGTVLMAQADMIQKGLHLHDVSNVPHMMLDIVAFHQKFGLEYVGKPRILDSDLFKFRRNFMQEELDEYSEEQAGLVVALTSDDGEPDNRRIALGLHQQLDALIDLVYVTLGAAYLQFGADNFHEAWRRVQVANMAKARCERKEDSKRGSTFDVIKPEGWQAPDHHDLVKDHAHIRYRKEGKLNPGSDVNGANQ